MCSDRGDVDAEARDVVVATYRQACRNSARAQTAFDAALDSYVAAYPHINRSFASQAVAYILSTEGL